MATQTSILKKLLKKRRTAQEAYNKLLAEPQTYSISGSVSATNQKLSELRAEIADIDSQIAAFVGNDSTGIIRHYPNYNHGIE